MIHESTILIVDDDPGARDTLEALLFREGYDLAFAGDGAEALEKAAQLTPDLILLDVMMPGMDGFEVCRRLRTDSLLADVPVVLITALDDIESRLRGIEAGADDFISKPFDGLELQARVRTTTRLNRYRRLLTERAKFEWVVEHAGDGYLIVDDADQVLYANPRSRLYLGLPADKDVPLSGTFLDLAGKQYCCEPEESWASWPVGVNGAPASARPPRYLVRPESPAATAFWLQVDVMQMSPQASLVRLRDVTTDIVRRSNVWTFHRLISHKLRTPLGPLVGFLDVLEQDLPTLPEAEVKTLLSLVREGAVRLQDEILDIFQYMETLDISRSGQGRCSLAKVSAIVTEIETGLDLESTGVTYHGVKDPSATFVPASGRTMELILWELCENAKVPS